MEDIEDIPQQVLEKSQSVDHESTILNLPDGTP
jgi:hypothetical protein